MDRLRLEWQHLQGTPTPTFTRTCRRLADKLRHGERRTDWRSPKTLARVGLVMSDSWAQTWLHAPRSFRLGQALTRAIPFQFTLAGMRDYPLDILTDVCCIFTMDLWSLRPDAAVDTNAYSVSGALDTIIALSMLTLV